MCFSSANQRCRNWELFSLASWKKLQGSILSTSPFGQMFPCVVELRSASLFTFSCLPTLEGNKPLRTPFTLCPLKSALSPWKRTLHPHSTLPTRPSTSFVYRGEDDVIRGHPSKQTVQQHSLYSYLGPFAPSYLFLHLNEAPSLHTTISGATHHGGFLLYSPISSQPRLCLAFVPLSWLVQECYL